MRRIPLTLAALLATTLLAAGSAQAQPAEVSPTDRAYLREQAQDTAYEIAIAQLALQKAAQPALKQYADLIVHDHEALNQKLAEVAALRSVPLPTDLKRRAQERLTRLQGLDGPAFDRAYIDETKRINKEDASDDQRELAATTDPAVRDYAQAVQAADAKHAALGDKLDGG